MLSYPSIKNVFKRDPIHFRIMEGQYSEPEFEQYKDAVWVFTEKVDGINVRFVSQPDNKLIEITGRNTYDSLPHPIRSQLQLIGSMLHNEVAPIVRQELSLVNSPVAFYGEGFGLGIQKAGKGYKKHQSFILFDIWTPNGYLSKPTISKCVGGFEIQTVPIVTLGVLELGIELVTQGLTSRIAEEDPTMLAEGLVASLQEEKTNPWGGRVITKIKTRDFYKGDKV